MGHVGCQRSRWQVAALLAVPGALLVASVGQAAPPPTEPPTGTAPADAAAAEVVVPGPGGMTEVPADLTGIDIYTGHKPATSRIAETDPALLGRTDATPISVVVKLDYDSIAAYDGTIDGLDATSPSVTGQELTGRSAAEREYEQYIVSEESTFAAELAAAVPEAALDSPLRTVYGGVQVILPANEVDALLAIPDVVAVQQDKLEQLQTDSSGEFIGATTLYPQLGGTARAGAGVIYGVLDSGVWPEHPSLAQTPQMGAPPASGTPRPCNFGDNPLTPAPDVFACNNKLIAGQVFLDTYLDVVDLVANPEMYPTTARDSNGHGTHTGTTTAGNALSSATVLGTERGPLAGIAPGAWVAAYKVCGSLGCYATDAVDAVEQAILDGVDVINFSISGGENPRTDPVELAFLDAYAAGVFVAASAGNSGPGASTTDHLSPWVTTVAASTQDRQFASTLTLTGTDGATTSYVGSTITGGIGQTPVVFPATDPLCLTEQPAGTYTGVIVACQRGPGRVLKGYTVRNAGAVGMILYNVTRPQTEMTDNHWLPTVHIDEGDEMRTWIQAHGIAGATFTAGVATPGQGDVMTDFSSRGPGGTVIKPDITAPGLQILAGQTPTPESPVEGPPGNSFQAIAGTSMSSPHIAGAAVLVKALHPTWTPGQIKSALMTTATTAVVKEDGATPADPFDFGAGRVDLTRAGNPGLTFDASAEDMFDVGTDPMTAVHLNMPSINVPDLPGQVETTRTALNTTGKRVRYRIEATSPAGSSIEVSPRMLVLNPDEARSIDITISSTLPVDVQQFGEIRFVPEAAGVPTLHMPVAFMSGQGAVTLASACNPTSVPKGAETTCTITAANTSFNETTVDLTTSVDSALRIVGATGATLSGDRVVLSTELDGVQLGTPSIAPGVLAGYIPLDAFGGTLVQSMGDEDLVNFNVPAFWYNGRPYSSIGVDSNGYLVPGGGTSEDNECCNPVIPSTSRPNNVLAPYWTDLDGTGRTGVMLNVLTDGVNSWLVVEWRVNLFGTTQERRFQTWIGLGSSQDITYAYVPGAPMSANGQPVVVGAENPAGTGGASLGPNVVPTTDLRVTSSDPAPGGSVSYTVLVRGQKVGPGVVTTEMDASEVLGTTVARSAVSVTPR
jgi:subtilisin family serine protease